MKKKKKHKSWKNYVKTWRCWVSNPGPSACKADALPLSYIPTWQTMPEIRELLMQVAKHIFSYPTYYTCTFSVREKEPTTLRSVQKYQTCKYTTQCNAHLGPTSAPSCFTPQPHLGQGVTVGYVVGSQEAPMPSSNLGSTFGMPTEQKKKKIQSFHTKTLSQTRHIQLRNNYKQLGIDLFVLPVFFMNAVL